MKFQARTMDQLGRIPLRGSYAPVTRAVQTKKAHERTGRVGPAAIAA